jgi:hypothetical protein
MLNIDETDASCVSCAAPGAGADAAAKTERAIVMVRAFICAGNPNGNKHEVGPRPFLAAALQTLQCLFHLSESPWSITHEGITHTISTCDKGVRFSDNILISKQLVRA